LENGFSLASSFVSDVHLEVPRYQNPFPWGAGCDQPFRIIAALHTTARQVLEDGPEEWLEQSVACAGTSRETAAD
jgi:hypothetical protein